MKSRKDIREKAKLDVNLKDIPSRSDQGSYVMSSGQKAILSAHFKLRELDSEIEELTDQKYRHLEEITMLGSVHLGMDQDDSGEVKKLKIKISELDDELELKLKDSAAIRRSFEKRGTIIPDWSATMEKKTEKQKEKTDWKKLFRQIAFFLAIEGFLIIIQFASLRDHLSLIEVIYRSVSVLAIAILIVHVHKKSAKKPSRINLVFIMFCIGMFVVSIALPPFLYQDIYSQTEVVADPFDLSDTGSELEQGTTSLLTERYLENTWIPAFLCVVFFLYLVYGHPLLRVKKKGLELEGNILESNDEFTHLKLIDRRIKEIKKERSDLEFEIKHLASEPTELVLVLGHLEGLMKASEECESSLKKLRVKFKDLMSLIENQLHVYQVEFMDFMRDENQLVVDVISKPEWPNNQDIINYYKTYNL